MSRAYTIPPSFGRRMATFLRRRYAQSFPLLAGVIVVGIARVLYLDLGLCHPNPLSRIDWPTLAAPGSYKDFVEESRARLAWGASALVMAVVLVMASVTCIGVIHRSLAVPRRRGFMARYRVVAGVLVASIWAGHLIAAERLCVGSSYIDDLRSSLAACSSASVANVTDWLTSMEATAVLLVFLGFAAVLSPHTGQSSGELRHLAVRSSRLQILLYVGAAMLITSTLETLYLYSWPASLLAPHGGSGTEQLVAKQATADQVRLLAGNISAATGIFLSLLLGVGYLASAFVLRARARILAESHSAEIPGDIDKWLEEHELGVPNKLTLLSRAVAVLGPLLAGVVISRILIALK